MPDKHTVIAVTTRAPAPESPPGYLFSGERGEGVRYARLTFSMPPGRTPGALPVNAERPDPTQHIALVSASVLNEASFAAALRQPKRVATTPRHAMVFVHGYNTTFDAAAVRFVQIVADTHFDGVPVMFSWPSRGNVTDYAYDRASADYSRDALEELLRRLAQSPNIDNITVFAHSMGNWLTMEALRQLTLTGDRRTISKIENVILAAPDVDMDVFRHQTSRLGRLIPDLTVYVSRDDYALRISRRLAGDKIRAGENTDLGQFHGLGIEAHDLSTVAGGIGRNHGKAFSDAGTLADIGRSLAEAKDSSRTGDLVADGLRTLAQSVTIAGEGLLPAIQGP